MAGRQGPFKRVKLDPELEIFDGPSFKTYNKRKPSSKPAFDLDSLLAEKAAAERKAQEAASTVTNVAESDSKESDDEDNLMFEEQAGKILQIAEEVNNKLQGGHSNEHKWVLWNNRVFVREKDETSPQSSNTWTGSPATLALLENHMLITYLNARGHCDEQTMQALFHTATRSSSHLEDPACHVVCDLISASDKVLPKTALGWVPNAQDFVNTFRDYGYQEKLEPCTDDNEQAGAQTCGPPGNIGSLFQILTACGEARERHQAFTPDEAQLLLITTATCLLDARLQPLIVSIQQCLDALINYFTDSEWNCRMPLIASELTRIGHRPIDSGHVIMQLPLGSERGVQLQQRAAMKALIATKGDLHLSKAVAPTPAGVVYMLTAGYADTVTNYAQLYFHLKLADVCLASMERADKKVLAKWVRWLEGMARIPALDLMSHAPQARNWASFLLQKYDFMLTSMET